MELDSKDPTWIPNGERLLERVLDTKEIFRSSEDSVFAYQLLAIAERLKNATAFDEIAGRVAKVVVWPSNLAFWCLKTGHPAAAFAVWENGKSDNLFPPHVEAEDTEDVRLLIPFAEKVLAEPMNQRNTFIALLLVEAYYELPSRGRSFARAEEVQREVLKRWGTVEHTNAGFLQQGNRVLLRNRHSDKSAAVPALQLWMDKYALNGLLPSEGETQQFEQR